MSTKNIQLLLLVAVAVIFTACKSTKHIAYLQGAESLSVAQLAQGKQQPVSTIKPNDVLRIVVSGSEDADTYIPFNLMVALPSGESSTYSSPTLQSYLVNSKGEIDFPVLGKLQVLNQTTTQVADMITAKLRDYLKGDVVVTVRFINYKISVLGEVNRPGAYTIRNEKVSLLEALSLAGDLTIYGRRDVVKILREGPGGQKKIITLNLNDKNLLLSPYFYLQQGDVVYVEPNKAKAKGSDVGAATSLWLSVTSIVIGVASLMVTLLKK
ncbi:polysaccharide biosynthesis/export family protein [Bacteroides sedimenti]|uniref:Polysaccharide export outer membrane protein n=1 Tax=Bacteroides sedimenti TaxID=2136147 RepID=A0ABN6YZV7_9BACE